MNVRPNTFPEDESYDSCLPLGNDRKADMFRITLSTATGLASVLWQPPTPATRIYPYAIKGTVNIFIRMYNPCTCFCRPAKLMLC